MRVRAVSIGVEAGEEEEVLDGGGHSRNLNTL